MTAVRPLPPPTTDQLTQALERPGFRAADALDNDTASLIDAVRTLTQGVERHCEEYRTARLADIEPIKAALAQYEAAAQRTSDKFRADVSALAESARKIYAEIAAKTAAIMEPQAGPAPANDGATAQSEAA